MRKRIMTPGPRGPAAGDQDWLNVEALAEVEISSEDAAHPIESALLPGGGSGWRAAAHRQIDDFIPVPNSRQG